MTIAKGNKILLFLYALEIFIVAAKRTPFGTYGGTLKAISPTELCKIASNAALKNNINEVKPGDINSVVVGNVIHASTDSIYISRHVGLKIGVPQSTPALTINRLCGSGFQSIINGCQEIVSGDANVVLCAGSENMSQSPYVVRDIRFGTKLGNDIKFEDALWQGLFDSYAKSAMAMTAENLADKYGITKSQANAYALTSQQRWAHAQAAGLFNEEMAPIAIEGKGGKWEKMLADEHPRPQTTVEGLEKLPTLFKKNGTVTAGNASGICDGAGAIIIADGKMCEKKKYKPLAQILSYHVTGCDPSIMGIGPVEAIREALRKANLTLKDMDLVEVNEAFASQCLAVEKELGLDPAKTNVNGGAIAIGHPLAASGSRIMAHLTHQLRLKGLKYAVGSACIGGGQGIAIVLSNPEKVTPHPHKSRG